METSQPTKENDIVAINNNYKVSKYEHTINEDKNEQIHLLIKICNKNLKSITEINKFSEKSNKHMQIQQRSNKRKITITTAIKIVKDSKKKEKHRTGK